LFSPGVHAERKDVDVLEEIYDADFAPQCSCQKSLKRVKKSGDQGLRLCLPKAANEDSRSDCQRNERFEIHFSLQLGFSNLWKIRLII
jgi:hypothetical protein